MFLIKLSKTCIFQLYWKNLHIKKDYANRHKSTICCIFWVTNVIKNIYYIHYHTKDQRQMHKFDTLYKIFNKKSCGKNNQFWRGKTKHCTLLERWINRVNYYQRQEKLWSKKKTKLSIKNTSEVPHLLLAYQSPCSHSIAELCPKWTFTTAKFSTAKSPCKITFAQIIISH